MDIENQIDSLLDDENYECNKLPTEEETIKQCSNIEIEEIINHEIGRGTFGIVFPIIANIGGKRETLVIKKITSKIQKKSDRNDLIKDMYYEVEYSYKMGSLDIGPIVYDAFYYDTSKELHQYIIMEKFDTSVRKWISSHDETLTKQNCNYVTQSMLDILHKQIFDIGLYCSDVKPDNYIINFNPIKVRMIDFGIDWCNSCHIPDLYVIIPELRKYSKQQHKEIFYSFCVLQLMMEMVKYLSHQNLIIFKWLLEPFYTNLLFKEYILSEITKNKSTTRPKRSKRRSLKRRHEITSIRQILLDILNYGKDQGITLAHYLKRDEKESNKDIINRTFYKLRKISLLLEKIH